jgi:hypothetical protein
VARRDVGRFTAIHTEGGLLPVDLLERILARDSGLEGLSESAYHLVDGRLHEAITESWTRLARVWTSFQGAVAQVGDKDPTTGLTRERWLLPLFRELGYGQLQATKPVEIDGKLYGVSHRWQHLPIHLVGWNVRLDERSPGVAGAARVTPHGLVQELLNRSKEHLWGVVSNGHLVRVLRDNASLTRQAYLQFDLEVIFRGGLYADFAMLWLLLHESRIEAERPDRCWLERWTQAAHQQGLRVLERFRGKVQEAIEALGRGFLRHPRNEALREALRSGRLDGLAYYRQLLRLVYRLLFLFAAEDRGVLLDPQADKAARERYSLYYSTSRLRELAGSSRGTSHGDRWQGLRLVMRTLGTDAGCPELGLSPLGSFLWAPAATPDLDPCELANRDLLRTVRALAWTEEARLRRPVDFRNLGSEELGSVYEALLELHPEIDTAAARFELKTAGGHERKTSGSYYTPRALIQCLLDSALDPVLDEAARSSDAEAALLGLKVCDPACGSGHFLVAAAHRIARRLAAVRTGDEEPSPDALGHALREVIGRCLYGVDVNEMAVELCKVALWMEALEPGKPLSFLDHRIVCGNSLLGTTPALLANGIPDEAFAAMQGDDKAIVTALRRRNRSERAGQMALPMATEPGSDYAVLSSAFGLLAGTSDESIAAVHVKEEQYRGLVTSSRYRNAKLIADAWCAAFVWPKVKGMIEAVTEDVFVRLTSYPDRVPATIQAQIERLAEQYRFLHWHLAFPHVFRLPKPGEEPDNPQAGWVGGFDVMLGNPPWERVKLQEKEWFATRRPDIAEAPNAAARRKRIAALETEDPQLWRTWLNALREADGESHLIRSSGRYPLCGRGDINTYSIFAETNRLILGFLGHIGCIVPSGIATDAPTQEFFRDLVESKALVSLYEFENEGFFPAAGQGHMLRFCLLTLNGRGRKSESPDFVFQAKAMDELAVPDRHFSMTAADFALVNPNTLTCPIFRSKRDAELTAAIYRRVPILIREGPPEQNPWGMRFLSMFHMTSDSGLFRTRPELQGNGWQLHDGAFRRGNDFYVPLYEAKMIHQFDHRFGDYAMVPAHKSAHRLPRPLEERLADPEYLPQPRYWVPRQAVEERLAEKWSRAWLIGWRDVTDSRASARTVVSAIIPRVGVGNKYLLMLPGVGTINIACLLANLNSRVLDYVARQKLGGLSLNHFVMKQLPVLAPDSYENGTPWDPQAMLAAWVSRRVLELTYTSWNLRKVACDLDYAGPPFRWDPRRRALLRIELDAAFFRLYGVMRHDVEYILGTFAGVGDEEDDPSTDAAQARRSMLEVCDAMEQAVTTGRPYLTRLDPPPADPRVAHPAAATLTNPTDD